MSVISINGRIVEAEHAHISAFDAGLQHGVGLFETLLAGTGPASARSLAEGAVQVGPGAWVFRPNEHFDRLAGSAAELGLTGTVRSEPLIEALAGVLDRAADGGGVGRYRVRVTLTGGDLNLLSGSRSAHSPTLIVAAQRATEYPDEMFERGVRVSIADLRANPLDPTAGHKTLAYWPRLRELAGAARKGAAEAIVLQVTNHLAGGCVSNVFVVDGDDLLTPIARGEEESSEPGPGSRVAADGRGRPGPALPSPVLPGVTRGWVMNWAGARGTPVVRRMLSVDDLLSADEVFLTNSSWGVLPVTAVEREAIGDGVVGPVAGELIERWRAATGH